jgi:hypothetical protein
MKTVILTFMIKILFQDVETKETLPAVKVITDKQTYYSNFDGYVNIPNDEKVLKITYNTYKTVENVNLENDTTIMLNQH